MKTCKNKIRSFKNISILIINSKKYGIKKVFFDTCYLDKVKEKNWHIFYDKYNYYVMGGGELLHRIITQCPKDKVVDHINHNGLDNRTINLNVCTHKENHLNRLTQTNNKSGCSGIDTHKGKYRLQFGKKRKHIGYYKTYEEALKKKQELLKIYKSEGNYEKISTFIETNR